MGEKRVSCKQAAGFLLPVNELLWFGTCCRGGCDVRQSCWPGGRGWDSVWGASCEESESTSCVTGEGSLWHWNWQHVFVLPETWPPQCWWYQDLRMPFFLSRHTDLKGGVTYYISHLLIHATYINILKCLSWWIDNFHNLVLVFRSVSSGIFKLFQWFGVCSLTKTSGAVFLLDAFPLWSVAQYKSVRLARSGIHGLCLLSLHSETTAYRSVCAIPKRIINIEIWGP